MKTAPNKAGYIMARFITEVCLLLGLILVMIFSMTVGVSLNVDCIIHDIYVGEAVTKDDIRVDYRTLTGMEHEISDYDLVNESDTVIRVSKGNLIKSVELNKIPADYITVAYTGKVYQYGPPSIDDLDVNVVYKNKHGRKLGSDEFTVEGMPDDLVEDVKVSVSSSFGSASVIVRPIEVRKILAEYRGGLSVGDVFDMSKVTFKVLFEDGKVIQPDDLSSDFEGEIHADSVIKVVSETYGEAVLGFDSAITGYDVTYDDVIYEGDILTRDKMHIIAKFEDGTSGEITDFAFEDVPIFETISVEAVSDSYGSLKCTIKPMKVKAVRADAVVGNDNLITINNLYLVYSDGHERELDMNDVTIVTDLSESLHIGDNEIAFMWHDHEYSFIEKINAPITID